jgi:hypothetical protein
MIPVFLDKDEIIHITNLLDSNYTAGYDKLHSRLLDALRDYDRIQASVDRASERFREALEISQDKSAKFKEAWGEFKNAIEKDSDEAGKIEARQD